MINPTRPEDVEVSFDAKKGTWKLSHSVFVRFEDVIPFGAAEYVEIPADFVSDLSSVPRLIWPIVSSFELSLLAPMFHDWGYQHKGVYTVTLDGQVKYAAEISRAEVDRLFLLLMKEADVRWWRRTYAYYAVRLFGGKAWGK